MAKKPPTKKTSVASKAAAKVASKVAVKAAPAKKAAAKPAPAKKAPAKKTATKPVLAAPAKKAASSSQVVAAKKVKGGAKSAAGKTKGRSATRSAPTGLQLGQLKLEDGVLKIVYGDGTEVAVDRLVNMDGGGELVLVVRLQDGAPVIRNQAVQDALAALKCFLDDYATSASGGSTCCPGSGC